MADVVLIGSWTACDVIDYKIRISHYFFMSKATDHELWSEATWYCKTGVNLRNLMNTTGAMDVFSTSTV